MGLVVVKISWEEGFDGRRIDMLVELKSVLSN